MYSEFWKRKTGISQQSIHNPVSPHNFCSNLSWYVLLHFIFFDKLQLCIHVCDFFRIAPKWTFLPCCSLVSHLYRFDQRQQVIESTSSVIWAPATVILVTECVGLTFQILFGKPFDNDIWLITGFNFWSMFCKIARIKFKGYFPFCLMIIITISFISNLTNVLCLLFYWSYFKMALASLYWCIIVVLYNLL